MYKIIFSIVLSAIALLPFTSSANEKGIQVYYSNDAKSKEITTIYPDQKLQIWESVPLSTDNSGSVKKLLLGTTVETFYCSISTNYFYRHGDPNRGGLGCAAYTENGSWYLEANGPTHNKNTYEGAAYVSCKAICIGM